MWFFMFSTPLFPYVREFHFSINREPSHVWRSQRVWTPYSLLNSVRTACHYRIFCIFRNLGFPCLPYLRLKSYFFYGCRVLCDKVASATHWHTWACGHDLSLDPRGYLLSCCRLFILYFVYNLNKKGTKFDHDLSAIHGDFSLLEHLSTVFEVVEAQLKHTFVN